MRPDITHCDWDCCQLHTATQEKQPSWCLYVRVRTSPFFQSWTIFKSWNIFIHCNVFCRPGGHGRPRDSPLHQHGSQCLPGPRRQREARLLQRPQSGPDLQRPHHGPGPRSPGQGKDRESPRLEVRDLDNDTKRWSLDMQGKNLLSSSDHVVAIASSLMS